MDQQFKDSLLIDIATNQRAINVHIAEIKEDLKDHMARTAANEKLIEITKEALLQDIAFMKKHVYFVQGALGLISLIAVIATILTKLNLI